MKSIELTSDLTVSGITTPGALSTDASDEWLTFKATNGDCSAFNCLVARYWNKGSAIAYRILDNVQDAEDIVQESFEKAWKNLQKRRGRTPFYPWFPFGPWFCSIVKNASIDHLRHKKAQKRYGTISLDELNELDSTLHERLASSNLMPDEQFQRGDALEMIRVALSSARLSERERQVVRLRHNEAMTQEEVAQVLGVTYQRVQQLWGQAMRKLREILREPLEALVDVETSRAQRSQLPSQETDG